MKKVCYSVVLQSQLGPRAGELVLLEDDCVVSGELFLLGRRSRFSGNVLQSGKYLISGALRPRLVTRHGCWDLTGVEVTASSAGRAEMEQAAAGTFAAISEKAL